MKFSKGICNNSKPCTRNNKCKSFTPAVSKTYEQAVENMTGLADLIIEDYGHPAKGLESTVAGVMGNELRIFRQGQIVIDI